MTEASINDLVAFLRARLDEGEIEARMMRENSPEQQVRGQPLYERWLREVEAKRAILDRHAPHQTAFYGLACDWCSEDVDDRPQLAKERWPCGDVRALAAVYSGHPDYRAEWKP